MDVLRRRQGLTDGVCSRGSIATLIELLVVAAVIALLASYLLRGSPGRPGISAHAERELSSQGIITTNARTIVGSTRTKLKQIEQLQEQQLQDALQSR